MVSVRGARPAHLRDGRGGRSGPLARLGVKEEGWPALEGVGAHAGRGGALARLGVKEQGWPGAAPRSLRPYAARPAPRPQAPALARQRAEAGPVRSGGGKLARMGVKDSGWW